MKPLTGSGPKTTIKNKQLSSAKKVFHEKPRGHMVGKQMSKPAKKQ